MNVLMVEYCEAVDNFLEDREELLSMRIRRRPWESEEFLGDYNLHSFIGGVFGDWAAILYLYLIIGFLFVNFLLLLRAMESDFIVLFLHVSYSTWFIFAVVGILLYHCQDQLDGLNFDALLESRTYNSQEFADYAHEIQHTIRERNSQEQDSTFDHISERMLLRPTAYMYFMLVSWLFVNFILFIPKLLTLSINVQFVTVLCILSLLILLFWQFANMYTRQFDSDLNLD